MWPFLNKVTTTCGCTHCTPSTSICYTGVNLSCIGVNKNDTLSVALQKINDLMCVPVTNSEIITALGYTPANDLNVVHRTGDETIAGEKTFTDNVQIIGNQKYLSINSADNETGAVVISTDVDGLPYVQLGLTSNENTAVIRADNINTNSVYQLPNSSGTIALEETVRPYKVYTAKIYQTGTNIPTVVNILENTLGMTPVITRQFAGRYLFTLPAEAADNNFFVSFTRTGGIVPTKFFTGTIPTNVELYVDVKDMTDTSSDVEGFFFIEIRIYN